jgi:hypothetical protein
MEGSKRVSRLEKTARMRASHESVGVWECEWKGSTRMQRDSLSICALVSSSHHLVSSLKESQRTRRCDP